MDSKTKHAENEQSEKEFLEKIAEYKKEYIKNNTIESMVYENGASTALLYKEVQRLSQLITTYINGKDETTTETN